MFSDHMNFVEKSFKCIVSTLHKAYPYKGVVARMWGGSSFMVISTGAGVYMTQIISTNVSFLVCPVTKAFRMWCGFLFVTALDQEP